MIKAHATDFESWRVIAKKLLAAKIEPENVLWHTPDQTDLFGDQLPMISANFAFNVSKAFIELAKAVACFRDDSKWSLLYRVFWRITHGEKYLLSLSVDKDIYEMRRMEKEVRRDNHKMKAFVRFRKVQDEPESFIAWHEPSHLIVKRVAPFFARRFAAMNWAILTPDESVYWDKETEELIFGPGVPRSEAPKEDDTEELWKTFYRNIFNPARIKVKMMKSEMPVKYWHTMPETALIPDMLREAEKRVQKMIEMSQLKVD